MFIVSRVFRRSSGVVVSRHSDSIDRRFALPHHHLKLRGGRPLVVVRDPDRGQLRQDSEFLGIRDLILSAAALRLLSLADDFERESAEIGSEN